MKIFKYIWMVMLAFMAASCQNNDYNIEPLKITPIDPSAITGALTGDDYVWSWTPQEGLDMIVSVYNGNVLYAQEAVTGTSYIHKNVDTNIDFTYIFRLTDGTNQSQGVIKHYMRPGASKMSGLSLSQVERTNGYDMLVQWDENATAKEVRLTAIAGSRKVEQKITDGSTSYTISDVTDGEEWDVTLIAANEEGTSLPIIGTLKIGKTAIGFLSVYPTVEDLMSQGDDDEICAWLWLNQEYPTAQYIYFGNVTSVSTIDNFRVLFWLRDMEGVEPGAVFEYPARVTAATPVIREWYKNGGNLLLWSHATAYIGELGRIDANLMKAANTIGTGAGGYNPDTWKMAVSLNPGGKFTRDHSTHPIYRGLTIENGDRCKLVPFKGPGWTEDHNCLYFDIPTALTGLGNEEEECYTQLVNTYGIYPLGTWDSQINWVSQLNVWEAQQGDTEFKGTVLCIGNGGCEFSMKNEDGTPDISAKPKNNPYQENVLKLAKNSLEYLKTR